MKIRGFLFINWSVFLSVIVSCLIGAGGCTEGSWLKAPQSTPVQLGVASEYPGDQGILNNSNVVFFTDFESPHWRNEWSKFKGVLNTISIDAKQKFVPLKGKALRTKLPEGKNLAMDMTYNFKEKTGSEPEEMYFRYYLRFGDDWNQIVYRGKLPGFSGTYGVAGWGGRRANGKNGWSARGVYERTIPSNNPTLAATPIGSYVYHVNQRRTYGVVWPWTKYNLGFLTKNCWYSIEQYIKLNTPFKNDGIIRAWVDGRLAFEKTDIRFRDVPSLKIEQVWMNIYHGGTATSPYDQHVFIDNVVIASKYIGPMNPLDDAIGKKCIPPGPPTMIRIE